MAYKLLNASTIKRQQCETMRLSANYNRPVIVVVVGAISIGDSMCYKIKIYRPFFIYFFYVPTKGQSI